MKWLAIETSNANGFVGIADNDTYYQQGLGDGKDQSQNILAAIQSLLSQAHLSLTQIEAIAVGQGPGSFTGLRVGVSVAQALAYALSIPVYAIDSLQILAEQARQVLQLPEVLVANDARIQEVYWCIFNQEEGLMQPGQNIANVSPPAQLITECPTTIALVGDAIQSYPELAKHFTSYYALAPRLSDMICLAKAKAAKGEAQDVLSLTPCYVRNKVAERSANSP